MKNAKLLEKTYALEKATRIIKEKKRKIHTLQSLNQQMQKKLSIMNTILEEFERKNLMQNEGCKILKSVCNIFKEFMLLCDINSEYIPICVIYI